MPVDFCVIFKNAYRFLHATHIFKNRRNNGNSIENCTLNVSYLFYANLLYEFRYYILSCNFTRNILTTVLMKFQNILYATHNVDTST